MSYIRRNNHQRIYSALSYGIASLLTQALMMTYLLIVAEQLGAELYGYIAASYAAISLSSFLFNWGFNQYMIKFGSTVSEPRELGGKVVFTKSALGLIWGILLYFILRFIRPDLYLSYILILTILEVGIDSLFGSLITILILQNRISIGSLLLVLSRLFRLILLFILVSINPRSIFLVLLLRLIAACFVFIITWMLTKPLFTNINLFEIRKLFRNSFVFNVSELLDLIYVNLDVNLLVWFGTDVKMIANYSIVISLITAIITLPSGIYHALLPTLIRTFKRNYRKYLFQSRLLYLFFTFLAFCFWAGITYLSKPIITTVLGSSYEDSVQILLLLAPLLSLRTFNQANIAYLISIGWQSKRLLPQLITLIIKLCVGLFVVSYFYIQGMIAVAIGSEIIIVITYLLPIIQHFRKKLIVENT